MSEQGMATGQAQIAQPEDFVVIDSGYHGAVELDTRSMTIRKRYFESEHVDAGRRAAEEFDYLRIFSRALEALPNVDCPRPLQLDADSGWLTMTHVDGMRVDRTLAEDPARIEPHIDQVAENVARAAELYITNFREPYFSLSTHNMLYDFDSRTLGLVDFTKSSFVHGADPVKDALAVTMGAFLGGTTYHTVRVRRLTWLNRDYWRGQKRLTVGVLSRLLARNDVSLRLVHQVSARKYRSIARNGNYLAKIWHATVGQVLFNRRSKEIINEVRRSARGSQRRVGP